MDEGLGGVKLCCWIALVEWSQLIRQTDGRLVPLARRQGSSTGERLTQRSLGVEVWKSLYYIYVLLIAFWVSNARVRVCAWIFILYKPLLQTQSKQLASTSKHLSAHTAPSVLLPPALLTVQSITGRNKQQFKELNLWFCVLLPFPVLHVQDVNVWRSERSHRLGMIRCLCEKVWVMLPVGKPTSACTHA